MAKIKPKDFKVEMHLRAIELLNSTLQSPVTSNEAISNFNFNISIENRADPKNKLIFVIVHIQICNDAKSETWGSLSLSCIFEIANFEEVVKIESNGRLDIHNQLIETLNSISISTARGILFSTFKGTFLHGAILPIVDPKGFHESKTKLKNQ